MYSKKGNRKNLEPELVVPKQESKSEYEPIVHDESNWLVSYADMMTLLCGFFIMMFSMARLDEPKYEGLKREVAKHFGGIYKPPHEEFAKFVTQVIQEAGVEKETTVIPDPWGVSVVFESTIFFETLSADVKPQGKIVLTKLIDGVSKRQETELKDYKIVVEGHTDNRPILSGIYPSNWELAGARASQVVRMFMEHGFSPHNLTAISYADTRPEVNARTPAGTLDDEALAKNRRVVIRILDPKVDAIPFPENVNTLAPQEAAASTH